MQDSGLEFSHAINSTTYPLLRTEEHSQTGKWVRQVLSWKEGYNTITNPIGTGIKVCFVTIGSSKSCCHRVFGGQRLFNCIGNTVQQFSKCQQLTQDIRIVIQISNRRWKSKVKLRNLHVQSSVFITWYEQIAFINHTDIASCVLFLSRLR